MSCPSRGVVARRREGGAGCGTRERGKRKPRPRAALGKPPRGTKTAGSVRLAVNAKAVMPRGASRGRGRTRHVRQGPGVPGPPVRSGRSGEIQAMRLLGAPLPSLGRRKRDGLSRARPQVRDQHSVGYFRKRLKRLSDDRAAAHPPLEGKGRPPQRKRRWSGWSENQRATFAFTQPR